MSFVGTAYRVSFLSGGFNGSENLRGISADSIIEPSRNVAIHNGLREKRGGTTRINATPVTNSPKILGLTDYRTDAGTQYVVFAAADGKVYSDSTTSIATGQDGSAYSSFASFKPSGGSLSLYKANGVDPVKVWTGSGSMSTIANPAADWSGTTQPKQILTHSPGGANTSARLVALGVPGKEENVYIAGSAGSANFASSPVILVVQTNDSSGVVGGIEFGNRLILFGRRQAFIAATDDTTTANWGVVPAQWKGGAAHWRVLVKSPNDLYAMTPEGEIYSVTAAQSYGDYLQASITRPSFMHTWIKDHVNMSMLDSFHACFDAYTQSVKWFVASAGSSVIDTCLVFHIGRPVDQAWTIHDALDNVGASGYEAAVSAEILTSSGFRVYTGDYKGTIWATEATTKADDGAGFTAVFRTPSLHADLPANDKRFCFLKMNYVVRGDYNVTMRWWVDGVEQTSQTLSTSGSGSVYGSGVYDTAIYGGQEVSMLEADIGSVGSVIQFEFKNNTAGQDFAFTDLLLMVVDRGIRHR